MRRPLEFLEEKALPLVLFAILILVLWLAMQRPLVAQETTDPIPEGAPPNCYFLRVLEVTRGSPMLGFLDELVGWGLFLCPAGESPVVEESSPLKSLLERMADEGPPVTRWTAGQYATASARWLEEKLCGGVNQIRSVSPPDPLDGRERSPLEIARWVCETVAAVPWDPETRRCDWKAEPLAPRPPNVRDEIRRWNLPPHVLAAWHDALKPIAADLCPR